jgi:phosphoglycerol transferase MdoB-like AlkP superfamily enzyme
MKMHLHLTRFKSLALNISLLLLIYTVTRFLFLIFNRETFNKFNTSEIFNAFLVGIRFDLSALAYLNVIYVLLAFLPFAFVFSRRYQLFLKIVFLVLNFPILVFHICDIEYYKFTGARITLALSAQGGELINQLDQFIINYWYIVLFCLAALYLLVFQYRQLASPAVDERVREPSSHDSLNGLPSLREAGPYILATLAFIVLAGLAARGGLGLKKPLSPSYAFTVTRDELAILALNSSFTIIKTHSRDRLTDVYFYPDVASAKSVLPQPEFNFKGHPRQNVIIIILESFATEFWGVANGGEGYTPFLDSLAKKGLFFRNNFANGRRSIEAVPSILLGLPSLMDHPLAKSRFQFNNWNGLGKILKSQGYSSAFFHGAERGSMHFDAVAKLAGIDQYFGLEDYPRPEDTDGHWGIFDEPYLKHVNEKISQMPTPFLAVAFTLSSHQPYPIPPDYKGKFKKGPTPLHESIGYADHAVATFFAAAEKEPWFKNTLFILTGDHTQMSPSVNYATELGRYMVPLLLYHPTLKLEANTQKITQHADVTPTIIDFLGLKNISLPLFGRSIWQNEGRAIFQANGRYTLIQSGEALTYDANTQTFSALDFKSGDPNQAAPTELKDKDAKLKRELEAYIQYFNNGLNLNQIY